MPKKPDDYRTHHRVDYEEPESRGYTSIRVLEFLNGHKWDEVALGYVHALRPSCIRVTEGEQTCDAWTWRVTVLVDGKNRIREIEQEVQVGLPEGVKHGHALGHALRFGQDSEQVKWHQDVGGGYFSGFGRYSKVDSKGNLVEFPKTIEEALLERREILPMLMGIHPDLDKKIEEAMKCPESSTSSETPQPQS